VVDGVAVDHRCGMDLAEYRAAARTEATRLAAAAERAGPDATVPTVPGWRVADLVHHVGGLVRGLTTLLETGERRPPEAADVAEWFAATVAADELVGWYGDVRARLDAAFAAADPAAELFTFLPTDAAVRFWARRDAHEIAIHRMDVELAGGAAVTPVAPSFAVDGIAELVAFLAARARPVSQAATVLAVHASDTGDAWLLAVDDGGVRPAVPGTAADTTVRARADDLYALLWNRRTPDGLDVTGDGAALTCWRTSARWEF